MGYRPTGRAAGRPRGPVTPDGKLKQARKTLPHVRAFPHLARAVDRVMAIPNSVVVRDWTADARDVDVIHRYTPQERGQALAFCWWVYINRSAWPRRKLTSAITAVSPLMLFSSSFFADMTGIPRSTATKNMVKPPNIDISRVTGSCDMWTVHKIIESATRGEGEYREIIYEMALYKGVPKTLLSRLSGVPVQGILKPDRGIHFFPEKPDWASGEVCSPEDYNAYWKYHPMEKKSYDPRPGSQRTARRVLAGTPLGHLHATSAPIAEEGEKPFHLCIPGLPSLRKNQEPDEYFFSRVSEWEMRYHLSSFPRREV